MSPSAAGWYIDPAARELRWWDGLQWVDRVPRRDVSTAEGAAAPELVGAGVGRGGDPVVDRDGGSRRPTPAAMATEIAPLDLPPLQLPASPRRLPPPPIAPPAAPAPVAATTPIAAPPDPQRRAAPAEGRTVLQLAAASPVLRRPVWAVTTALLVIVGLVAGGVAFHNDRTAQAWATRAGVYKQVSADASSKLANANASLSAANGQITSLQSQLSGVANAKAKAQDGEVVLSDLAAAAGQVAAALSTCATDSLQLTTDILNGDDTFSLESIATDVVSQCQAAQAANGQLQQLLDGS